jgi:AcrR family transcriptional regulator
LEVRLSSELVPTTADHRRKERADSVVNRARVLAAARIEFAEHGLDALIPDVAARAGVGKGTVYRHFPTKEALVQALLDDYWRHIEEMLDLALASDDPWEGFTTLIHGIFTIKAEHRAACDIMMASPSERPKPPLSGRLHEALYELFRRAQAARMARLDVPDDTMSVLLRSLSAAVKASSELHVDWQPFVTVMLDGLRAPARQP